MEYLTESQFQVQLHAWRVVEILAYNMRRDESTFTLLRKRRNSTRIYIVDTRWKEDEYACVFIQDGTIKVRYKAYY